MKYLMSLLLVAVLVINLEAQTAGIEFSHTDWETTLAKAKEENKLIFVDCYTDWCGPCKWMSANVFPDEGVADYYNDKFINVKIDMEKGEGILFAKAYNVRAYPTLMFVDAKGNMVHKALGSRAVEDFIALGNAASDPDQQIGGMMAKYEAGEKDPAFLMKYSEALQNAGMKESGAVAEAYLASQKDWSTEENINYIYKMMPYDVNSDLYKYVAKNKANFYKHVDEEKVDSKLSRGVYMVVRKMDNPTGEEVAAAYQKVFPQKFRRYADEYHLNTLMYSKDKSEEFLTFAVTYMEKYEIDSWQTLNSIAWKFYEMTDDEALLLKARDWAKKSVAAESNFYNNDTLAAICYKLKEKGPAAKHAQIAIELAKENGSDYAETEALLQKINALK